MDQFEYVMVLVSIIIGLGIAHLLLGLSGIVDRLVRRRRPLRISVAYFAWLLETFVWLLLFWWWEFRFPDFIDQWTVGLYFFLVVYAVTLFLMAALLVPSTWDPVEDLGEYFLERRSWFYALQLSIAVFCVVGYRATSLKVHAALGLGAAVLAHHRPGLHPELPPTSAPGWRTMGATTESLA